MMNPILVAGLFNGVQAGEMRFLEEAAKLGPLHVFLWDEPAAQFPLAERRYFLEAVRYVSQVTVIPADPLKTDVRLNVPGIWAWPAGEDTPERRAFCGRHGLPFRVIPNSQMQGFPEPTLSPAQSGKKVIVTGCFDYIHSGHVRFFEEASEYGDLYVVVGSDANVRLLKGDGHPLFPQAQRRYLAGAFRFVRAALVSSGSGWMDAAPEIERLRPDIYLVNEDGDRPAKRQFCAENGLEYVVLKRTPSPGLPRRSSTDLRGF